MKRRCSSSPVPIALVAVLGVLSGPGTPAFAQGASVCETVVPCQDPAGCPDVAVDRTHLGEWFIGTETFDPMSCTVLEGHVQAGTRRLLLFPTWLANVGAGDLILGDPETGYPEIFEYATCHGHYHVRDYAVYRLWRPAHYLSWLALKKANPDVCTAELLRLHPELGVRVVSGFKEGFCLMSLDPICTDPPLPPYSNFNCAFQGIDAGWSDVYTADTEGQWIDITGVSPGPYILELDVNTERRIRESNYVNNAASIAIEIPAP